MHIIHEKVPELFVVGIRSGHEPAPAQLGIGQIFPDGLDRRDDASFTRVWQAQMPQIAIPFMGLPALTVTTGLVGRVPVGVQVVSGRYREDLCLLAGEAIEAGGTPSTPVDPVS